MKIVDVANELFAELGQPSTLSLPPIVFWLRTNIGNLNSRLNASYDIDGSTFELTPDLGHKEKDILKKMYMIHHYDSKLRESLGAASTDTWVEIQSDGTSVRRVNKVQQSQTYQVAKRTEMEDLEKLVHAYKMSGSAPLQVAGDDTVEGSYSSSTIQIRERE
tara:strand:- start:1221 stop:1706 length:486 start_codon:yes stop_codon:yes gene_type:complete